MSTLARTILSAVNTPRFRKSFSTRALVSIAARNMAGTESTIEFLPLGAIIQTLKVAGVDIVLNFATQDDYAAHNSQHFGATIGRVANRISNAKIDSLNGQSYPLAANNGVNNLHGGNVGWGKRIWDGPVPVGVKSVPGVDGLDGGESVKFSIVSKDGDEGFPGTVHASVVYTSGTQKGPNGEEVTVLAQEYEAELVDGADETAINMTNHSYFNLTGGPSIEGTVVTLATNTYLPVDDGGIPTDKPKTFSKVEGNKAFTLGATEPDIDDCFVLNEHSASIPIDTRGEKLVKQVWAHHPESGLHLEVLSTEPAFQFYTGKYIEVPAVGGKPERTPRSGFCVEPSRYVNAVNEPEWKNQTLLKKGEKYGARIVYRIWKQ